jgi:hypothetical protein
MLQLHHQIRQRIDTSERFYRARPGMEDLWPPATLAAAYGESGSTAVSSVADKVAGAP